MTVKTCCRWRFNGTRDARATVLLHDGKSGCFYIEKLDGSAAAAGREGVLPLRSLCTAALVTIFLQLVIGATLRHSATWDQHLPTQLILAHIGGALAVTIALGIPALTTVEAT